MKTENLSIQKRIIEVVKKLRKEVKPNLINVDNVITSSLFSNGGTLAGYEKQIQLYLSANLSAYEIACGYVQKIESEFLYKELYKEYSCYHVRSVKNHLPHLHNKKLASPILTIWQSFDKLSEARKFFNKIY